MKGTVIKCEEKKWPGGGIYYSMGVQGPQGKLYGTANPKKNPAIQNWRLNEKTILFEATQDGDWWRFHDMSVEITQEPPPPEEERVYPVAERVQANREVMIARECSAKLTEAVMLKRAELGLSCTPSLLGRLAKFWTQFIQSGQVPYSEDEFEDQELFKMTVEELSDLQDDTTAREPVDEESPFSETKEEPEVKPGSLSDAITHIRKLAKDVGGEMQIRANQQLAVGLSESDAWGLVNLLRQSKKAMKV